MRATVVIDGKETDVNKTARFSLPAGESKITIRAKNFGERTITVFVDETKPDGALTQYGVLLFPENEDGENLLRRERESEWRDYVGQLEALNTSIDLERELPLLAYLPHQDVNFRVDYAIPPKDDTTTAKYIVWITANSKQLFKLLVTGLLRLIQKRSTTYEPGAQAKCQSEPPQVHHGSQAVNDVSDLQLQRGKFSIKQAE